MAACHKCNNRKANQTPAEAGMRLLLTPYTPTRTQLANL
jgi:5-methylcytosine-specific restriction endonuclease McrA